MKKANLDLACKKVTAQVGALIEELAELENSRDDEVAYSIINTIGKLHAAIEMAREAGMDSRGNDVLDAYERVAQAIRDAKRRCDE